jgi:hypothetical protein
VRYKLRRVPIRAAMAVAAVMIAGTLGLAVPGASPALASGPPAGSLTAQDLQLAYGLPSATQGSGQTVAVVAAYDDPDAATDLAAYRSAEGLPACGSGCFTKVNQKGQTAVADLPAPGVAVATSQSLDAVSAVCPNCKILLVEASSTAMSDLGTAVNEAVTLGAKFVDFGYGEPEAQVNTGELADDAAYFNHPGVVITAPSGDQGYGVDYPAASPDVIAVGGTVLTPDSGVARGWDEAMWPDSGSGCSAYEPQPAWQASAGLGTVCSARVLNDVSAVASNVAYYDTPDETGWADGSGTEISAAVVAAAFALAGTPASDAYPAQYLYSNAQGLYDMTTGYQGVTTNGTCPVTVECTVGTGYDGPTGLGTPDGVSAMLASYYVPITPTRFMDTRIGTGGTTGPVGSDKAIPLAIEGKNGVPSANVTAVAINLTAIGGSDSGYINAYPGGTSLPGTSNIDYAAGQAIANFAIVPLGANGGIQLYNSGAGTVQLLADVAGYFTSDPSATGVTSYTPVNPVRVLDTRNGNGAPEAPLAAKTTLAVQIGGVDGIPSSVSSVAISVGTVDETDGGFLEYWADGSSEPSPWSNIQFGTGAIQEFAIVPVGADGKIDIRSDQLGSANSTDVFGDVVGYFAAGTTGEGYRAVALTRELNTKPSDTPIASYGTMSVPTTGWVTAPDVTPVVDLVAIPADSGHLTVYPAGTGEPNTSNVNYFADTNTEDLDLASTGDGDFDVYNGTASATNIAVDLQGYFSAG